MATHIKTSPELRKQVDKAIESGNWEFEKGSKHQRLRHKASGRMVTFALSSSDRNAAKFFARDLRHVEAGLPGWGQPQTIEGVASLKKSRYTSVTA